MTDLVTLEARLQADANAILDRNLSSRRYVVFDIEYVYDREGQRRADRHAADPRGITVETRPGKTKKRKAETRWPFHRIACISSMTLMVLPTGIKVENRPDARRQSAAFNHHQSCPPPAKISRRWRFRILRNYLMAKKPSKKRSYVIVSSNVLPATVIPGTNVVAEAAYRNDRHPHGPGPWDGEPDKIAWTDRATGYPCVIVRERSGEYGAHVGVPPDHSLSGYTADAVPGAISQGLHRPVSCAQACQRRVPEPVSICHVSERTAHFARQMAAGPENEDDAWWLGMLFDGPRDLVPMGRERKLAAERGEAYRDARFAYEQATLLARRLYEWDAKSDGSLPILRSSEEGDGQ